MALPMTLPWETPLRAAVATLDLASVKEAAAAAESAILQISDEDLQHELQEGFTLLGYHAEIFVRIIWEVLATATEPDKQGPASACANALISSFHSIFYDFDQQCPGHFSFYDSNGSMTDTLFYQVPPGPPKLALRCYLTQMALWTGWCYRAGEMEYEICQLQKNDSVVRMVERVIWLVASLFQMPGTNPSWYSLVTDAMFMNGHGDLSTMVMNGLHVDIPSSCFELGPEDMGFKHEALDWFDPSQLVSLGVFLARMKRLDKQDAAFGYFGTPPLRGLFQRMRVARKEAELSLNLPRQRVDEHTMAAAWSYLAQLKRDHYRGLFRKWWVAWSTVSRWTTAVGEAQGAVTGEIGAAAVAAYDAE